MISKIVKNPFSRTIRVSVIADRMTVAHVLDFAAALRESGIGMKEYVTADRSYGTAHFCGLSAHYTETLTVEPGGEALR